MDTKPWDTIGTSIQVADSLADAMEEANVNFNVSLRQGYFTSPAATVNAKPLYKEAKGNLFVVRDDIDAVLGSCKTRFSPLQNADAFSFFNPLIEKGVCTIDTLGCFGLGEKVWMLAKINDFGCEVVKGDRIELYLLLVNSHDGSTSVTAGLVPIRVWCSNMFSMLSRSEYQVVKFKHTGDTSQKLTDVTMYLQDQVNLVKSGCLGLQALAEKWPSSNELDNYFREVFKIREGSSVKSENKIKRLHELFIHGRGNQEKDVRGTWYAAFNAATEYLNYEAGRAPDTRLKSLWFGANKSLCRDALEIALNSI